MNLGGIGEIALAKLLGFLLEMRLDQRNLLAIRLVLSRDGLQTAILKWRAASELHGRYREAALHNDGPSPMIDSNIDVQSQGGTTA